MVRTSLVPPVRPSVRRLAGRAALALLVPLGAARGQSVCTPAIEYGVNPSFQTWSSRAIAFADAFQRARRMDLWQDGAPAGAAPLLPPDAAVGAGWPDPARLPAGMRFGARLFVAMEGTIPDGTSQPFVVTWQGAGEARLEGVYVVGERNRGPNRVEVLIDPLRGNRNSPLSVTWSAADPADPVRDVRVWLPGMEGSGNVFWPPFLTKLGQMNANRGPHTLRTLDWSRVNEYGRAVSHGGFVFDLAGVITPASASQGTFRGVATAYQVLLCNALGSNLHLNVPHRANGLSLADWRTYITEQLGIVRDGAPGVPGVNGGRPFPPLAPGLTVTVELSNEIWNTGFPVNHWMNGQANALGIPFTQMIADETQVLFDTARAVFAGPHAGRLKTYLGGFVGDPGHVRRVLEKLRPGTQVDELGPAAYLAPRQPEINAWLAGASPGVCPSCPDADALLDVLDAAVEIVRPKLEQHRSIAQQWTNPDGSHPALVLYEGGINLKAANRPWLQAAIEVQARQELFAILHARYVPMLIDTGVERIHWYSFMTDQDAPTVDAFGFWNDMEQRVTLPVVMPYADEGAPKGSLLNLGPPLAGWCPPAGVNVRQVPGGLGVHDATLPRLGGVSRATVDLRVDGGTSSFVIVALVPAGSTAPPAHNLTLALGRTSLLPVRRGPIATWDVRVPNDPGLAGVRMESQAVLMGGTEGMALSNVVTMTLGR